MFSPTFVFAQAQTGNNLPIAPVITPPLPPSFIPPPSPQSFTADQVLKKELKNAQPNEQVAGPITLAGEVEKAACTNVGWFSAKQIPCAFYRILDAAVTFVVVFPLTLSSALLEHVIQINIQGAGYQGDFVAIGWSISRDIANMFFVFIVLWMALATVFQFDSYSAKRLLPKLVIVALLVNFSLPIGRFVIDASNAIAQIFYAQAAGKRGLLTQIMNMTNVTATMETAEFKKAAPEGLSECKEFQNAGGTKIGFWQKLKLTLGGSSGNEQVDKATEACIRAFQQAKMDKEKTGGAVSLAFVALFWKLGIGLVSSFVFFAGAIFMLVRYLSLVILLIFGPLAFFAMILPATHKHWEDWWEKLIQWSLFAPFFLFMLMLSVRLSASLLPAASAKPPAEQSAASLFLNYTLTVGLFIASLLVAQRMGIAMSGTVVGWGKGLTGYAKGKGIQYAKIGAGGIAGGIQSNALLQRTLSAIPLMGGTIARGLGATRAMGEAAEKRRQRQKFGFAERLSDEARANYIASERPGNARDMLTKMDEGDRRRTVNALSTQGQIELAQKLRSVQSEALVGNATNNPEVYARLSGEAGPLDSKDYLTKVAKIAHEKFNAKNIAPDYLRGDSGREYLKTATEAELKAIAATRQGAEALGGTLAEVARTIHEEAQAYITSPAGIVHQNVVPKDYEQHVANIKNQYLSPQTQQYLNTAPGMFEGRMAIRTRRGGENDQEDEDEQFFRRIRKASQRGLFQQPEN